MTIEELKAEFLLIQAKTSNLSRGKRDYVVESIGLLEQIPELVKEYEQLKLQDKTYCRIVGKVRGKKSDLLVAENSEALAIITKYPIYDNQKYEIVEKGIVKLPNKFRISVILKNNLKLEYVIENKILEELIPFLLKENALFLIDQVFNVLYKKSNIIDISV